MTVDDTSLACVVRPDVVRDLLEALLGSLLLTDFVVEVLAIEGQPQTLTLGNAQTVMGIGPGCTRRCRSRRPSAERISVAHPPFVLAPPLRVLKALRPLSREQQGRAQDPVNDFEGREAR